MKLNYKKLENFISEPKRGYITDAGADVFATQDKLLFPGERYAMPLGFAIEVPEYYMAIIVTKSGTFKRGLFAHIPPIDCGYTGEAHALLENNTNEPFEIKKGDKVAQLIVVPIETPEFVEVLEFKNEETERGSGAFGSTGTTLKR